MSKRKTPQAGQLLCPGLVVVFLISLGAPSAGAKESRKTRAPDIVLITIDTLRQDHLSCYGYERRTTPFIDGIAEQGAIFTNAYSTSSWTVPSMASLLTGLYPRSHGVRHGLIRGDGSKRIDNQEMLAPSLSTLPELLQAAGYTTFGVSSNGHLAPELGFDQGFDHYAFGWFRKSPFSNRAAIQWRAEIEAAPSFFLWVHYFDPHPPYLSREPWIHQYSSNQKATEEWSGVQWNRRVNKKNFARLREDPSGLQAVIDLYDSEISYCDQQIRELFDALPRLANSLVVITSDHGEAFHEHDQFGHGKSLHEEVVLVPLIIKLPGTGSRKTVESPVSNKDVVATILQAAGLEVPVGLEGTGLLAAMTGEAPPPREPVFTELDRFHTWQAIRDGSWKLISGHRGRRLLYNLAEDPSEERNRVRDRTVDKQRLEAELAAWAADHPVFAAPTANVQLDDDQLDQLRALGYIE
ncbi:MAG: sulfatase-like hydrolase/transferase [bacterium]|nr:sulfatase-like hydrolase/transferase [bacterium]